MTDSDVQVALRSILVTGLPAQGFSGVTVQRSFQPTSQGAPLSPVVYFTKIFARRYGYQGRKYAYAAPDFTKTESWFLNATYQIGTLATQDADDPNSLNAYDIADMCAGILQTSETRETLLASGIGILRITDIRTPSTLDDSDRFTPDASFDLVFTYQNTLTTIVSEAEVSGTVQSV